MSSFTSAALLDTDVSSLIADNKVHAFGVTEYGGQIKDVTIDFKPLTGRQISVKVIAVSVNPVDGKLRTNRGKPGVLTAPLVMGYDGAGTMISYFIVAN